MEEDKIELSSLLAMIGNLRVNLERYCVTSSELITKKALVGIYTELRKDFLDDDIAELMMYKEYRGYNADEFVRNQWAKEDAEKIAKIKKVLVGLATKKTEKV